MNKTNKWTAQIEGAKRANTGKKLTKRHKARIVRARKGQRKFIIKAYKLKGEEILIFPTMSSCARKLKCSRQLISQCVRRPQIFKSAMGYLIEKTTRTENTHI